MEFPKYLNYEDFKEFFLIDFEVEKNKGETLLKYSHKLLKIYLDWKDYTRSHLSNEQVNQLFKIVCKGTIYENYDLFDSDNTDNELALQVFYINIMFKELDLIQIIDYLKNEIEKEKINILRFQGTTQKEIAEPANITHSTHEYTDEITQNKYSVPQKIKILDMLNIKGWLMDKHNFTTFQIEELLSDLFDRTDKTIRNSFSDSKHENTAQQYLEGLKKVKAKR
ncbi:hypothetical protein [Epilithonimonas sp.]|uniref:hypothetical protein n=1 Tax=Epilithonimonas sp. TaxID=2894511 RepID=UPI0028A02971|nr:hypothetical protein [Epilithonimonas sp.]